MASLDSNSTETANPAATEPLVSAVEPQSGTAETAVSPQTIQRHDFRQPAFLSASELRKLRQQHESLTHVLAARLSIYLRMEFGVQLARFEAVTYQNFVDSLANPCHLTLFKAEPLRGICLLNINPRLALAIIDRMMGGAGTAETATRELSEVETALLDQIVQLMLSEWCHHWSGLQELRPVLLGHENSARFLHTSSGESILVVITLEARFGDCTEQFQFAFPHTTLEPLIQSLNAQLSPGAEKPAPAAQPVPKWNRVFDNVLIALVADWSGLKLTARDLARLKIGDVVPLPPEFSTRIRVRLGSTSKFLGRLGTSDQRWAIELTEVLRT
jgi:flagellar motor switch protein FliM